MIPYGKQNIIQADIREVVKVLKSDWLTQGPKVLEFEKALAKYCGAKYAVACSNGTAALHLAYLAAGLKNGDEAITTPNTFAATANMLLAVGARPVFCDIRADTYNIDEKRIEKLISKKTKVIVPVHFAGNPCEMGKIKGIAKKNKLIVIEDACHALGAGYQNSKIGDCQYSDMAVFSFHPVKGITTGEGGAILTNNIRYYRKMMELRTHGIVKNPEKLKVQGGWYMEMLSLGYNYRITDLQCALGISQLKRISKFIKAREKIAARYYKNLKGEENIVLPQLTKNSKSAWHLFVILVKGQKRKIIYDKLRKAGIGAQIHYIPVYRHQYYRGQGYGRIKLKEGENYYRACVSLPIFPDLKTKDQDYVISILKKSL